MTRPSPFLRTASWITLLVSLVLGPGASAGDDDDRSLTPDQIARMILLAEGPQQTFVAQYLERARADELIEIQEALRRAATTLAPTLRERAAESEERHDAAVADTATMVQMDVRILEVPADSALFEQIGVEEGGFVVALLDAAQAALITAEAAAGRAQLLSAPRLTSFDRQRANVSVVNQISFVQDFEAEVADGKTIVDPVIGIVQEGVVLDLRPTVSADKCSITLEFDGTWAFVKQPIPERQILLGGQTVTIQLPEIDVGNAHASTTLPSGGWLLVRSARSFQRGAETVRRAALIQTRVVD